MWPGSEYARVSQGSKYAAIWLNMSEQDVNMPEYVGNYNNGVLNMYHTYNAQSKVTLQVNEYLLRDRCIQNSVKDLRWSTLEK